MSVSDTTYTHVLDGYHRQKNDIDKLRAENADLKARLKAEKRANAKAREFVKFVGSLEKNDPNARKGKRWDILSDVLNSLVGEAAEMAKNWRKARGEGR